MNGEGSNKSKKKRGWKHHVKNQTLWGIMLIPKFWILLIIYLSFTVILAIFGGSMLGVALNINDLKVRYDNVWTTGTNWTLKFTPDKTLSSPYIYYELHNFYGNHRNFLKSRSYSQLRGNTGISLSDCSPITSNSDVSSTLYNLNNVKLSSGGDANPCGLIAKYMFSDSFTLYKSSNKIAIDETEISQYVDRNYKFMRPNDYKNIQWHDTQDEHLMVWYEPDALPDFIKLYGKVSSDLMAGTEYTIVINNKFDISGASINKYIYISETSAFGGNNIVSGILYLSASGVLFLLSLLMISCELKKRFAPNKSIKIVASKS